MSKKDGKSYVIVYNVGTYTFHEPYLYKTFIGAVNAINRLKDHHPWYKSIRVLLVDKQNNVENKEYYIIDNELIPITDESKLLYGDE